MLVQLTTTMNIGQKTITKNLLETNEVDFIRDRPVMGKDDNKTKLLSVLEPT